MNQKKTEGTELPLCNKLKKLSFSGRKQTDLVFKFASLVTRHKKVGFYVIDESVKGEFCDKALKCATALEYAKVSVDLKKIDKIREIASLQKEVEEKMENLIKKIKELDE